jgi:hypothetical protein
MIARRGEVSWSSRTIFPAKEMDHGVDLVRISTRRADRSRRDGDVVNSRRIFS